MKTRRKYTFSIRELVIVIRGMGLFFVTWLLSAAGLDAHMLNATRVAIYFSGDKDFVADVHVDLAQTGIEYEEYYELTRKSESDRAASIEPLLEAVRNDIIFQFDGWPVSMEVGDYDLPGGDLAHFLDYYQPKMTRVRLVGEIPGDAAVLSLATAENSRFEFPVMTRIEMPGRDLPASTLLGEAGERSGPIVLALDSASEEIGDDEWAAFVVGVGEGVLRAWGSWVPNQMEVILVAAGLILLIGCRSLSKARTGVLVECLAVVVFGLATGVILPVTWLMEVSPFSASFAILGLAGLMMLQGRGGSRRGGPYAICFLSGIGLWQMAPLAGLEDPGFLYGYGVSVFLLFALVLLAAGSLRFALRGIIAEEFPEGAMKVYALVSMSLGVIWLGFSLVRIY